MITYSVPLVYDKTVYGVLGIEVGVNDLAKYFPVKDLDSNLNAGFALVVDHGNGNYEGIAGEGALYDAVSRDGRDFVLEEPEQGALRLAQRSHCWETEDLRICEQSGAVQQKCAV